MKYFLLSVSKNKDFGYINIGDYIQALASSQYYPRVDGFLDRDEDLKDYNGEDAMMIMNGWYMHNAENWPPSVNIKPLFVAFHLNFLVKEKLTNRQSIEYLKSHEPIGCRDLDTMNILKNCGVNAYFSGCMTLTLGKKYYSSKRDNRTYIVDPLISGHIGIKRGWQAVCHFLRYPKDIYLLFNNSNLHLYDGKSKLKKWMRTSLYHKEYSRCFSRNIVMNSVYVCQQSRDYIQNFDSDEKRLREAERLVKLYARAKLVITSRIHCALPCMGLETPVIFLKQQNDTYASSCRLGGLQNLFNIVEVGEGNLCPKFGCKLPITVDNCPKNKDNWRNLAKALENICSTFMNKGQGTQ